MKLLVQILSFCKETLAVLSFEINLPVLIERLKISERMVEISFMKRCKILFGILNGPVDLFGSSFLMMATISAGSIGEKKKEFWTRLPM